MSIGHLKDDGSKGYNYPWQYRMLKGLELINDSVVANGTPVVTVNAYTVPLPTALDAFGRQRVSEPYTLGDYKHIYGLDPSFIEKTANGGTVTFQANKACARLATNNNAASSSIHQSKFYHQYLPGKSQLIYCTFNMYASVSNVTKRTGYYDDENGVYFEQAGNGTLSFCVRSFTSGVVSDAEKVAQINWNVDPCNGLGPSGFNLDITKTQILFIDFQWLGVGKVRVGFVHEGNYVVAHEFQHDNLLTEVYMSTPNLPIRCEVFNTGATAGGYMDQICSTVLSEGGYQEAGQDWSFFNESLISLTSGSTLPIFAIRLKNTFNTYLNRMVVRLSQFTILSTKEPVSYQIVKLPNAAAFTTGTAWVDVHANSGVQYNIGGTTYVDGQQLATGYVAASAAGKESITANASPSTAKKNYIVQNYDSTDSEIYVIVVKNLGTTSTTVGASMQWREIY